MLERSMVVSSPICIICEHYLRWFVGASELVDDPKNGVVVDNSKEHKSKLQLDAISRKHEGECQQQRLIKMSPCINSQCCTRKRFSAFEFSIKSPSPIPCSVTQMFACDRQWMLAVLTRAVRFADVWGVKLSRFKQDVSPAHGAWQTLHARGKSLTLSSISFIYHLGGDKTV